MSEEDAAKLYAEFMQLTQQESQLDSHLNGIREQLAAIDQTIETIKAIANLNEKTETWMPIAPGAYAKATVEPKQPILLNIGASVAVEQEPSEVVKTLEGHRKILSELADAAVEELDALSIRAHEIRDLVQSGALGMPPAPAHSHEHHGHEHAHHH